nr:YceI family protein [Micromonospora sp. DSM 115978]
VTAATFEVDMASVATDSDNRDNAYRTRIMATDTYPTSIFELTEPIELAPVPEDNTPRTYTAVGDLTLRGVTNPVTIELETQRTGDEIRLVGQIGIVFADYDIPNPSVAGFVTTEDNGVMEIDLRLQKD